MNSWAFTAGIGIFAVTIATIAFVAYRQREAASLLREAELARSLRELADGDAVRLAAVDEFETTVYRRLFYSSVIGPRLRSVAWALLGAVLAGAGVLALDTFDGVVAMVMWGVLLAATVVFALAALGYAGAAIFHAATTPRVTVSYTEPSDDE
ncbi:hypothetical protein L5G28_04405 [Gordonia sp. HY285]|uniref:Uncharacterized protein n=1 Tax=Gordonia liuliyuniae TaxID=2911517 RepID=A0ABS9IT30_9ACTN|nr:hypothetical protein [Gordonia liuliyuniae]MCF8588709.1 hypothetical protein [Gordonia liuliyuniae]MCF8609403.1 hypothetical protein [Gordonia liuliyuniae]